MTIRFGYLLNAQSLMGSIYIGILDIGYIGKCTKCDFGGFAKAAEVGHIANRNDCRGLKSQPTNVILEIYHK